MPYLPKENLIFIHIPKTGGSSIEVLFGMDNMESLHFARWDLHQAEFLERFAHLIPVAKLNFEPQHYTPDILKNFIPNYDRGFKFAFVRNPYTRIISEYFWRNNNSPSYDNFDPFQFDVWCRNYLRDLNESHKITQSEYIQGSIQFIGRFENFEGDMKRLINEIVEYNPDLAHFQNIAIPHVNSTKGDKTILVDLMLPETRQLIFATYETDFKLLGYAG